MPPFGDKNPEGKIHHCTAGPNEDHIHYCNASGQMVILRCIGDGAFFLEKVIFPFEDFLFRCPPQSRIEIWTHGITGAELLDTFRSEDLLVSLDAAKPGASPAPSQSRREQTSGH